MTTPKDDPRTDTTESAMAAPARITEVEDSAPPAAPPPAKPRRIGVLLVVGLLLLAGLGWGGRKLAYARAHESTDNAQVDGHIVPVLAKVGGYVQAVSAVENAAAADGQLLVQLDDSEYRVRLAQAEAELRAAEAVVGGHGRTGQAQAAVATAVGQRAAGSAQVASARATLTRAEADYARYRELAEKQIVSQQQLDAARAALDQARANLTAVQQQTAAASGSEAGAEAGVRLAQARLAAARAARDNAALQLSYTRIVAPAGGTIARKQVEVGQLVQPGQTLMSIVADTGVWITANFKETQLATVRVGQRVEVDVDAYGGARVDGVVESISSATGARFALLPPDNATGNFTKVVQRVPVRILLTSTLGAARPLRPGMSVAAHVATR